MKIKRVLLMMVVLFSISLQVLAINYKVRKTVSVKSDFKSRPTFYKNKLQFMDRGKLLYIGRSASWDKQYIYLYDLVKLCKIRKKVPLDNFFKKNKSLLINRKLSKSVGTRVWKTFSIEKLYFYDRSRGLAGIEIRNRSSQAKKDRYIFLYWDLKRNVIKKGIVLSHSKPYEYYTYLGGYDFVKNVYYLVRTEPKNATSIKIDGYQSRVTGKSDDGQIDNCQNRDELNSNERDDNGRNNNEDNDEGDDEDDYESLRNSSERIALVFSGAGKSKRKNVAIYAISQSSVRKIAHFVTTTGLSKIHFSRKQHKLYISEYTENYLKHQAYGYLVDLVSGKYKAMKIPSTPYGMAFGSKGKVVYIASSETGFVWAINVKTGRRIKKARGWRLGHGLGFIKSGLLVWVRNSYLVFFEVPSLKRVKIISTKKFYKGFCHVQGSIIKPGMIILQNGDKFKIIDF